MPSPRHAGSPAAARSARQYQFIGKLMRDIDMDALEAALDAQAERAEGAC